MSQSYAQYFQDAYSQDGTRTGYIRAHYDVTGFCNGRLSIKGMTGNILSRLKSCLIEGINDQELLPRAIIMIIDGDLLVEIKHNKPGVSEALGRTMEWIVNQFHRVITGYKEKLPSKARKFKYPTILWCLLPENVSFGKWNEYRRKCNKAMIGSVRLFREMDTLEIQGWDQGDKHLVINNCMTKNGLLSYWQGVNDAFESWDRDQMKSKITGIDGGRRLMVDAKKKKKNSWHRENTKKKDRFKWKVEETSFKLPALKT